MLKKFELSDEIKAFHGIPGREVVLHRIRAVIDFPTIHPHLLCDIDDITDDNITDDDLANLYADMYQFPLIIHAGDLGGWVESEANLSQSGLCWIHDQAHVTGNARVANDAQVYNHAWLTDHALVSGRAYVGGQAQMHDHAIVKGCASLSGHALLHDYAQLEDSAQATDYAWLSGATWLYRSVVADGHTRITGGNISRQHEVPKWYPARISRNKKYLLV